MVRKDFQRKKVESLTLGEQLVELRKNRQVSIAEFAKNTKIQRKYIEALESGQYGDLPSAVYIKGFLHTYEQYFSVAERSLIRVFEREYLIYKNIHEQKNPDRDVLATKRQYVPQFVITPRILVAALVILCIVGIVGYVYSGVDKFVSAPWVIVETPTQGEEVVDAQVTVRGTTHPEARIFLNEEPVVVMEDGHFEEQIGLVPGDNEITIRSVNKSGKETIQKITVVAAFEKAVREESFENESGVHLELRTEETPTWLSVVADDVEVFSGIMEAEQQQVFDAQQEVRVTAGVANAVYVRVGDAEEQLLGEDADIIKDVVFSAPENPTQEEDVVDEESVENKKDENVDVQ